MDKTLITAGTITILGTIVVNIYCLWFASNVDWVTICLFYFAGGLTMLFGLLNDEGGEI